MVTSLMGHAMKSIYKHKLQVIQNNALKIALNKNNLYSTVDLHIEAKILPCKYRRLMML